LDRKVCVSSSLTARTNFKAPDGALSWPEGYELHGEDADCKAPERAQANANRLDTE